MMYLFTYLGASDSIAQRSVRQSYTVDDLGEGSRGVRTCTYYAGSQEFSVDDQRGKDSS